MRVVPIDDCPGLTEDDRALLRSMGVDRAYYGRIVDTIHFYVYAIPLYQLTDRIYAGFMPEIQDPCLIELRDDEVIVYDQYEASESLFQLESLRPKILRYFNATPHTLQDAISAINRIFVGERSKLAALALVIASVLSALLHILSL